MADACKEINENKISPLPFSTCEKEVIERVIEINSPKPSLESDFNDYYEIDKCTRLIKEHGFQKAALQFPDNLLCDSAKVSSILQKETQIQTFILADTSYGSCCVDEVAAEHVQADVIIHYGRSCLSWTKKLPVIFVFGKQQLNVDDCCYHFKRLFPEVTCDILVLFDVVYSHKIEQLQRALLSSHPNVVFSNLKYSTKKFFLDFDLSTLQGNKIDMAENTSKNKDHNDIDGSSTPLNSSKEDNKQNSIEEMEIDHCEQCRFGRQFKLQPNRSLEDYSIFYIGGPSGLTLRNLMMSYNKCKFFTYDPETGKSRQESLDVNRALMRRYYLIQKAKDANVVGVVVGTLGVVDYLKIIQRIKEVLRISGKKSYLFVMGKLNVAKMANFMEIDVYVLVACPENTLIDTQDFYKPVITPYELEIACLRSREWTGDYVTDFRELLPGAACSVDLEKEVTERSSEDAVDVSLITGNLRNIYTGDKEQSTSTSLVERNENMTLSTLHHTNAAEFLAGRSWKGLEQKVGDTSVTMATEGRRGIAAGYTNEESHQ